MGIVSGLLEKFGELKANFFYFINLILLISLRLLHIFIVLFNLLNINFITSILLNKFIQFFPHFRFSFFLLILYPRISIKFPVIFSFF